MSIDEVTCRLTGSDCQRSRALALADRIKQAIADRVGAEMRSSIGIAPNSFLAKVASDMQKPDGCVVIEDVDLPECLYGLALRDLCGIGRAMEQRLNRGGIRIDSLNLRYGKNTLYFGGAHAALYAAPMRIAFGHIPDLAVEGDD